MESTQSNEKRSQEIWNRLVSASRKKQEPLYSQYVNHTVAIPITYLLWKLGLHPNVVSLMSTTLTHAAFLILILNPISVPITVLAWLLLALAFVLDSCDGQLARAAQQSSKLGEWLDHTLDMIKLLNFHMTLGYIMLRDPNFAGVPQAVTFLTLFLNLLSQPTNYFVLNVKDHLLGKSAPSISASPPSLKKTIVRFMLNGSDYGIFILIVLLLPWPNVFLTIYLLHGIYFMTIFIAHYARVSLSLRKV